MKYDYIVWDFNGTILDDVDLCLSLLNKMLRENGLPLVTKERYLDIFTFPIIEYYKAAGFDFEKVSFADLAIEFIEDYQPRSFKCGFVKGVIKTITTLKERGYKQICLSASQIDNLIEQMEKLNIKHYFNDIKGIENIHGASKIDIAIKFREEIGHDKKVLMIGDSIHDKEVADAMNADCYLVALGHQNKRRLLESSKNVIDCSTELLNILD